MSPPSFAGEPGLSKGPPKATDCPLWGFTSYADMVAMLETLAAGRPDLARVETIGTTVRGRAIVGLRVSDNVGTDEMEPEARIIGALHGNECMAFEVALGIAQTLITDYGTDPTCTAVVDGVETMIVPMANPDGSVDSTRGNANDVDLNRNFPFMWVPGVSSGSPGSELETRALRDDGLLHPYVLGVSYHTAANYVNLVWNYTPVAPRHEPELRALFEPYAVGTTYDVVLGWFWYSVYGEYTDHNYGTRGALDTIIEIQSDFGRVAQRALHVPRAIALLALARDGLAGRVTDAATGAPLSASIWVAQRRAPVFTEPGLGDFHEVLVAGTYDVTVIAPRHRFVTLPGVDVPPVGAAWLDVSLEPSVESYGFAVAEVILPRGVGDADYANMSVPSDALGPPDGSAFFLEPGGEIVIDLALDVDDHDGPELRVYAGPDGSMDRAAVRGAATSDGPWTPLGSIVGSADIDLAGSGLASLRFVRIVDTTGGRFGSLRAGFDLDAIEVLPLPAADADADADVVDDADADAEADAEADGPGDADVEIDASPDADADGPDTDAVADSADDGPTGDDGAIDSAGDTSSDVGDGGETDGGGSGCGCNVAADPPGGGASVPLALLVLLALVRHGRRPMRVPARDSSSRAAPG